MGLLPNDFYRMLYADFLIAQRGYKDKVNEDRRVLRMAVTQLMNNVRERKDQLKEFQLFYLDGDDELREEIKNSRSSSADRSLNRLKAMKRLEAWKKKEQGQKPKSN